MCMGIYLKRLLCAYVFEVMLTFSFTDQGIYLFNETNVLLLHSVSVTVTVTSVSLSIL